MPRKESQAYPFPQTEQSLLPPCVFRPKDKHISPTSQDKLRETESVDTHVPQTQARVHPRHTQLSPTGLISTHDTTDVLRAQAQGTLSDCGKRAHTPSAQSGKEGLTEKHTAHLQLSAGTHISAKATYTLKGGTGAKCWAHLPVHGSLHRKSFFTRHSPLRALKCAEETQGDNSLSITLKRQDILFPLPGID